MERSGEEREREAPPATDDEDATQPTTQEDCWRRAGVIPQAQPTAQHHQKITAGLASGAKRRAAAMSQGERAAKRMTDQQRRRREQRESKQSQPAPITFDAAVAKVASEAPGSSRRG